LQNQLPRVKKMEITLAFAWRLRVWFLGRMEDR